MDPRLNIKLLVMAFAIHHCMQHKVFPCDFAMFEHAVHLMVSEFIFWLVIFRASLRNYLKACVSKFDLYLNISYYDVVRLITMATGWCR
jgi:hypothetical protein